LKSGKDGGQTLSGQQLPPLDFATSKSPEIHLSKKLMAKKGQGFLDSISKDTL
jgi:hypothetical protein